MQITPRIIVAMLAERRIRLEPLPDNRIRVIGVSNLTDADRDLIRQQKSALLAHLRAANDTNQWTRPELATAIARALIRYAIPLSRHE